MRLKVIILLALLTMLAGLTACGEKAAPTATAADLADITLVPYVSEEFSIRGVVPKGWVKVKPGQFQRIPGTDSALAAGKLRV